MLLSKLQLAEPQHSANSQAASILHRTDTHVHRRAARDERVKRMETLRCRCSRCQQKQRRLHDPCVPLTAANRRAGSRSSLRQGSSSPPVRMTLFKCFLTTRAFATPYSSVTSRGRGGISKGAGGVQAEKGLGKAEDNALFLSSVLGNGELDKRHATGRRGGMGTQRKMQPCRKPSLSPSQLLGCFRGRMEAGMERPCRHKHPLSLLHGKCSLDRGFGSGYGVGAPV